jgi:transposase
MQRHALTDAQWARLQPSLPRRPQGRKATAPHSSANRRPFASTTRKITASTNNVEVCFHELKRFRAIGTRYDKTKTSFLALLQVACICLWLN